MRAVLSTATRLRVGLAAVVVFVSTVQGLGAVVLPWALLVVACDLVAGYLLAHEDVLLPHRTRGAAAAVTLCGGAAAGLSVLAGPGALPLFAVPLFRAGERGRRRLVVFTVVAVVMGAGVASLVRPQLGTTAPQMLLWIGLAAALGVLASWEERISARPDDDPITGEAALLLSRLAELSSSLEGGLDPALLAERVLDALPADASRRSAVLVGPPGGHAVPLTLRGAVRVPWAQPTSDPAGIIGSAWCDGRVSYGFAGGRALVAAPLLDTHGTQVGLLLTDRLADVGPDQDEVAVVVSAGERHSAALAVALAYVALREQAGLEERRELARTMHDGVAQEVAALGFQLDMIRYAAAQAGDSVANELVELRQEVARILGDVRANITDLRVGIRPEHGLGAALSTRLQQFGTATGAEVRVSLKESGFRLPPATEVRLYRVLLDVLSDAQRHDAALVEVELVVAAPHFSMTISHDGATSLKQPRLAQRLEGESATLSVVSDADSGTTVSCFLQPTEERPAPPPTDPAPTLRRDGSQLLAVAS